jgi:tetratricopeptide (TPR) repeat protein
MAGMYKNLGRTMREDEEIKRVALARPASERELAHRPDRLKQYLMKYMEDFAFDEFSGAYLKKSGLTAIMNGVPVPLRKEDMEAFRSEKGLGLNVIGENMARVVGIDPNFQHMEAYVAFIARFLHKRATGLLTKQAQKSAERESYDEACILFRAALVTKWDDLAAMYGYAKVCRALYNQCDDADTIGRLKAESFDYLELLTEIYPRFATGWYYLGYMYLNMGLYTKAKLTWEGFLARSSEGKERREIQQRLEQIQTPIEIENGYNAVMAGRWQEGISILEPYTHSAYRDWWPLWYYLGEAFLHTERRDEAVAAFKSLLKLNGTHVETMEALVKLYAQDGNAEMVKKYTDKIALIKTPIDK